VATLGDIIRESAAYLTERGVDSPALSARLMAGKALGLDSSGLVLAATRELTPDEHEAVWVLVRRRGQGEPAAYILGEKEFYGLAMRVGPGVLVPRPETELLVDTARKLFAPDAPIFFADLGTGSGCIAVAVAVHFPKARGLAVDASTAAITKTVDNVALHGVGRRVVPVLGDFRTPFAKNESLDLILANPPYVSDAEYAELSREVADFEPEPALKGGADGCAPGLDLAHSAAAALKPGGVILMEIGFTQGKRFRSALSGPELPFKTVSILPDLAGLDRVVLAVKSD
jgi:release factor glutamine methyltransferase